MTAIHVQPIHQMSTAVIVFLDFSIFLPVRPLLAYTNPQVETIAGRTVRLSCIVLLGNPRPTITWIKMGQKVESSKRYDDDGNGVLTISDTRVDDEGEYTCVASNVGGNATYVTNLDVQGEFMCFTWYLPNSHHGNM